MSDRLKAGLSCEQSSTSESLSHAHPAFAGKPLTDSSALQETEARLWPYVYPSKYPDAQKQEEEQRWREERERERERERKGKEERPRPKEAMTKEESKESSDPRSVATPSEEHRSITKDPRAAAHMAFSSSLAQHQSYMPYVHSYPYGQGYDPGHPGYRSMPSVMMQNYPGERRGFSDRTLQLAGWGSVVLSPRG